MTHVPLYREALKSAWQLTRKEKWLWLFGLFAAFLGQMGLFELFVNVTAASSDYAVYPRWIALPRLMQEGAAAGPLVLPVEGWVWFFFVLCIVLGLALAFLFIALASQGAIIASMAQWAKKKKADVAAAWHVGARHVWRLFAIQAIKKTAFVFLALAVGYATLNVVVEETTSAGDLAVFFLVFLLALAVGFVLSFLAVYAAGYVVVEEYPLLRSLEEAWRLFLKHWLVSLEVGLIILLFNLLLGLAIAIGVIFLFLPVILLWFVAALTANVALFQAALIVGMLLSTVWILFALALFTVFGTGAWTYLFMIMHKHGITSRIFHFWHAVKR